MEPFSTATAETQLSSTSVSPNSFWIGTPRMPNMSHTANINVNAMVDMTMTRTDPGAVGWSGATSINLVDIGGFLMGEASSRSASRLLVVAGADRIPAAAPTGRGLARVGVA